MGSIEGEVKCRQEEIARNEKNIAVLLEKVTTIEDLVREMRQDLARVSRGYDSAARARP